jgi:hypothetical protein
MLFAISLRGHISKHSIFRSHSHKNLTVFFRKIRRSKNILVWIISNDDKKIKFLKIGTLKYGSCYTYPPLALT